MQGFDLSSVCSSSQIISLVFVSLRLTRLAPLPPACVRAALLFLASASQPRRLFCLRPSASASILVLFLSPPPRRQTSGSNPASQTAAHHQLHSLDTPPSFSRPLLAHLNTQSGRSQLPARHRCQHCDTNCLHLIINGAT